MKRWVIPILVLVTVTALFCSGCEDVVLDTAYTMAFGKHIELTTASAPPGKVGLPYRWEVHAEVKNEAFDNLYDYEFELSDGALPPGLSFVTFTRRVAVEGTPRVPGDYPVAIRVDSDRLRLDAAEIDSHVWSSSDTEEYIIHIDP